MINLTLNNVPSFTTTLILNAGAKEITIPVTPSTGVLNAVVPIPADEYVLTVKLKDDNDNIFYTKPRTSKTYTARNYYTTNPITLNHYIEITNSIDDNHKLAIQTRLWSNGDYLAYVDNWEKYTLFVRADGTTKYYLLSETDSNLSEGKPLRIQLYSGDTEKSETSVVFNFRNISFDVSENSLKTKYRIYPRSEYGTYSSPYIYVYKTVDEVDTPISNIWPGNGLAKKNNIDSEVYYEFGTTYYGASNISVIFSDNGANQMSTWSGFVVNRDYEYKYW